MTRIHIYSADPWNSAISYLRIREPADYLGWELFPAKNNAEIDLNSIAEADYAIIQRDFPRFSQCEEIIQKAKQHKIPVIYEVDDYIFDTPEYNKQFEAYRYYFNGILNTILAADRVIVSSTSLYRQLSNFNKNIYIFPNYLPDKIWKLREPVVGDSNTLTIGYMGSSTHRQDLEWLGPALLKIIEQNKNIHLKMWGCLPSDHFRHKSEVQFIDINFQDYVQYADYFQEQSCDVFIAPLLDNPFNQGKSGIKFLEYSALGIPGVYMKLEPYLDYIQDGENGFLAGSLDEWEDKLNRLISNPDLRLNMARNAQKTVQQNLISNHFAEWEKAVTGSQPPFEMEKSSGEISNTLDVIREINSKTQKAIWDIQLDLANAVDKVASLTQQVVDLENEKTGLNQKIDAILNSRTWKMAKSIQSFTQIFKSKKE